MVNEIDNRGSHFYLTMYWAQELARQDKDPELKEKFTKVAAQLEENEVRINDEMMAAQGSPMDLGGYYKTDPNLAGPAMRPSQTFNGIIASVNA